ncbi:hypothetical protein PSU4_43750 [Pseudonocardia sulfidoxydans NBRC 16205]|uniref:Formate dehydrogenase subunit delta n=1 Tax=Pseudonocardia sulfidoxydans NBRC 16205 TaxID=1223511 RepID=A0A511DKS8_9PSEU|nr:formate dehydrogenase subunit delta [Pseudonocardia sulfidoxydans]GEL25421.1 hypothetical protein PSU4_43750 [Pseudonocardia sulfidoxydans NBRC 16205]
MDELGPEVRMVSDIVVQFAHRPADDAAAAIAAHLRRFWDPRMRRRLVAAVDAGADVDPVVVRVAQLLSSSAPAS